jgi:hypothetical protein
LSVILFWMLPDQGTLPVNGASAKHPSKDELADGPPDKAGTTIRNIPNAK